MSLGGRNRPPDAESRRVLLLSRRPKDPALATLGDHDTRAGLASVVRGVAPTPQGLKVVMGAVLPWDSLRQEDPAVVGSPHLAIGGPLPGPHGLRAGLPPEKRAEPATKAPPAPVPRFSPRLGHKPSSIGLAVLPTGVASELLVVPFQSVLRCCQAPRPHLRHLVL